MAERIYEIFSGEELKIAELIQRRRLQMLVHSYIYYEMDSNVITDYQWSSWANELAKLQADYPEIEQKVPFRDGFENWDASTGAFLPLHQDWIVRKANVLLGFEVPKKKAPAKKPAKSVNTARKSLF